MSVHHVLVTGGAGFIGSHTVDLLVGAGHRVTVLDDLSTGHRANLADHLDQGAVQLVEADVAQPLTPLLAAAETDGGPITGVVHLAAQTSVVQSLADPGEDLRVNVGGTLAVLELAGARDAPIVFASSAAVYGDVATFPVAESAPCAPISPYGIHKYASELHLRAAAPRVGSTCLRFFNVYGPRQDPRSPYSGVISIFIDRARAQTPLTIFGDGTQTRDFVSVRDVSRAITTALWRPDAQGEAINIGTGRELSVTALARAVVTAAESGSEVCYAPSRDGEIARSVCANARAQALLGFAPNVSIDAGLAETVAWSRAAS